MGVENLAVAVLQVIAAVAVQHAGQSPIERGRVLAAFDAEPGGFDADHLHAGLVEEGVEQADGVGAAADAGDQRVGQPSLGLLHLRAHLFADHVLEVAHHDRVGVRPGRRADEVVGVLDMGDPVAQRLVHRVLERSRAGSHRPHLRPQQIHAEDIGLLPLDVGRAHIDDAGQVEQRADRGGGDAVLAGAGLGDDAPLAHAPGKQNLPDGVVDLVRAGVVEVLALQIDLGALQVPGQALGEIERRRPADVMLEVIVELGLEGGILAGRLIGALDLEHQRHERLGDKTPAIDAVKPALVGPAAEGIGGCHVL